MHRRPITRRRLLAGLGGLGLAGVVGACGRGDDDAPAATRTPTSSPSQTPVPATATQTGAMPTPADDVPLEVAVGQVMLLGFRGTELTPDNPVYADIRERRLGGVVLFDYDVASGQPGRNITSPEQLRALTGHLQEAAGETPMLVTVDQEGGQVQRLNPDNGFPGRPSHADIGARGDPAYARQVGANIGETLAAHGIAMNFAPCVDVNTNPDNPIIGAIGRSFSADPDVVTEMAAAYIEGMAEQGVGCCLKHFPGHGSSTGDSHAGFVDVTETWADLELEPYRVLLTQGAADAVMAAHVFNANLDPEYPASLSRATIDGLLRDELGFDGVVITDDLQMGAIAGEYGFEEALRLALLAGNDILALGNNLEFVPDLGARVHGTVLDLVRRGDVPEARVREAYRRVRRLKDRLLPAG